ncbi:MAG TPA: PAS domain S-box protein [Ideonella sp.]|nr:PAS domain S-box protein [Ideonella sp.]
MAQAHLSAVQFAVDQIGEAAFLIDEHARILFVNEESCRSMGYRRDEMLRFTIADIDPDWDRQQWPQRWLKIREQRSLTFERRHRTRSGRVFPVELQVSYFEFGGRAYCLGLARDITRQKQAQEMLVRREREFRALADNSPDLIVRHDRLGKRVYVNPALRQLSGQPHGESGATAAPRWLRSPVGRLYRELLAQVAATGETRLATLRYRRADGRPGWLDVRICSEVDEQGAVESMLTVARDVTELVARRDELEAQVQSRTADLLEATRKANAANKAKSEFLTLISHEIRTQLNGVIGMTEILCTTSLDEHQQRFVKSAKLSGQNLLALLCDVLDLAKIDASEMRLERQAIDLKELAAEAVAPIVATAATKQLALEIHTAPEAPPRIWADPLRLRQVLVNLLGNAAKFTEQGAVRLQISCVPGGAATARRTRLRFEVIDSGIGIPAESLPHIFETYVQAEGSTARRYGGTGLGLAISARLVKMMGGVLLAESTPGLGSRFHFELDVEPAATSAPSAAAAGPGNMLANRREHAALRSLRVLVVDDCPVNQEIAQAMLRHLGVESQKADDGHEALERVATQAFDLVFMDCMMPGLDGLGAARHIRHLEQQGGRDGALVIVALTANASAEDSAQCLAAGMDDVLTKPLSLASMRNMLHRVERRIALRRDSRRGLDPA